MSTREILDKYVERWGKMPISAFSANDICTIEQAIAVACRSLDAGGIGWYQYVEKGRDWLHYGDRLWVYFKNSKACCVNPYGFESAGLNLEGGGFRPIKDIQ